MTEQVQIPAGQALEEGRLLTISEAAAATGLSVKAITRRIQRETIRSVRTREGRRVIPRAELERLGLIAEGIPAGQSTEVVLWRELYEREHAEHVQVREERDELRSELVAIANAGLFRGYKLRKAARARAK